MTSESSFSLLNLNDIEIVHLPFSSSDYTLAVEAGKDGATIFRTLIGTHGFARAAEQARRIILTQCPIGFIYIASIHFNRTVENSYKARPFKNKFGQDNICIVEDRPADMEITLQLFQYSDPRCGEHLTRDCA